jgi:outer membrane lipoprotein-sorting protein
MKTMSQLIIGTINGESLRNNADFKIDYFTSSKEYLIILTPTDKNIKKFLSSIELYLDNSTFLATQMIMNEQSGDVTKYSFSNVEKNEEIANSLFVLD